MNFYPSFYNPLSFIFNKLNYHTTAQVQFLLQYQQDKSRCEVHIGFTDLNKNGVYQRTEKLVIDDLLPAKSMASIV